MTTFDVETARRVVAAAHTAPSADNLQPWRFRAEAAGLTIEFDTTRRLATDVGDMCGLVGLGAAIENVVLAASGEGYTATVTYARARPTNYGGGAAVARIAFGAGAEPDPLVAAIPDRCTNRRPFRRTPLAAAELDRLTTAAEAAGGHVDWAASVDERRAAGDLVSENDWIRLSHEPFHRELFEVLRLTKKEARHARDGLDLFTLEMPLTVRVLARSLKSYELTRRLNKVGLAHAIARESGVLVAGSGGVGLITADERTPQAYLAAGRALQRLWLTATSMGLALQPFAGLPQYMTKVELEPSTFHPSHADHLRRLAPRVRALFPSCAARFPAILLRVGTPLGPPSARSLRRPLDDVIA